jgi:hypothetical protein
VAVFIAVQPQTAARFCVVDEDMNYSRMLYFTLKPKLMFAHS